MKYNLEKTHYPNYYLYATLHGGIEIGGYIERGETTLEEEQAGGADSNLNHLGKRKTHPGL